MPSRVTAHFNPLVQVGVLVRGISMVRDDGSFNLRNLRNLCTAAFASPFFNYVFLFYFSFLLSFLLLSFFSFPFIFLLSFLLLFSSSLFLISLLFFFPSFSSSFSTHFSCLLIFLLLNHTDSYHSTNNGVGWPARGFLRALRARPFQGALIAPLFFAATRVHARPSRRAPKHFVTSRASFLQPSINRLFLPQHNPGSPPTTLWKFPRKITTVLRCLEIAKMGIKNLFSIIKDEAPEAIKEGDIKTQFGRKVAIVSRAAHSLHGSG